jgi:hypothetical protein
MGSQESETGLFSEPAESSPHTSFLFLGSISLLSTHILLYLPTNLFPSGFKPKPCVHFFKSHAHNRPFHRVWTQRKPMIQFGGIFV